MARWREAIHGSGIFPGSPEAKRIKARDHNSALGDQHALCLAQQMVGIMGDLQRVGQDQQI